MSFLQSLKFGLRLLANKRVTPGVPAIIKNSRGEILLGKRSKNVFTYPGYWGLPGGIIEYGETVEQAIKRELKEELGIESEFIKYGKPYTDLPTKESPFHGIAIPVYCSIKGEPESKDETSEVKWFKPKEIKEMNLAYNHKKILKQEGVI
ncbi:MAG: NUDIX hydrolase [Candidatus Nanoarchaeia archaeon]|nr:NUDIX hydrolase [Candidatus Nanoarchaeia archaeon]